MEKIYHAAGPDTGYAKGIFDPKTFAQSALGRAVQEMKAVFYEHQFEPTHPEVIRHWTEKGVKQEIFDADKPPQEEMLFSILSPLQLEKGKQYPLIYCLHGGGETAFGAQFYGYADFIGKGEFIGAFPTASLHGNEKVEREFLRILEFLKANNYPIDFTRVYVVGFSGGEGATQRIAMLHADKVAAIAPTPGPNSFRGSSLPTLQARYNERYGLEMPMICLGGSLDGGDMWPLDTEQCIGSFNFYMHNAAKVINYTPLTLQRTQEIAKSSNDTVARLFGIEFPETWIHDMSGISVYFGEFYGPKGHSTARFGSIIGLPHTQCPLQAMFIWRYIKCFSRDLKTGESVFTLREINGAHK